MKKKLLLLLLALTSFSISNRSLLADPSPSQSSSASQGDNGFVMINEQPGLFEIEVAPVSVREYAAFLTAVAAKQDPHVLYNAEMKNLITYHQPWFQTPYYSAAPGKANLPMTCITLVDAMRYSNWKESGEPTAEQDAVSTEEGAYDFGNLNADGLPTANAHAFYQLPTSDQLAAAYSNANVTFLADGFNEWTLDEAAVADNVVSVNPVTGKMIPPTQSEEITFALFNDETQQFSFLPSDGASEISANNGFRLVKKVTQMEQAAGATTDSTSADNPNISSGAGDSSQQPMASQPSTGTPVKKLRTSKRDQSLLRDASMLLDVATIAGYITMLVLF